MLPARSLLATTTLGFTLLAGTAMADLTASQVWGDWRGYLEGLGYSVTADQNTTDNTLFVRDITVQIDGDDDTETVSISVGDLQFLEQGDGSVGIMMPANMPIIVDITPDDGGKPAKIALDYTQTGHAMTVRGDADALSYDYTAVTFGLALTSLVVDGAPVESTDANFALKGDNVRSVTEVTAGDVRTYKQNAEMGNIVYDIAFNDPESGEAMSLKSTVGRVVMSGTSSIPIEVLAQTDDLAPLLGAGFSFDGTLDTTGTENRIELTSIDGVSRIKTATQSASLGLAVNPDGVKYDVAAEQVQMGGQLAGVPFPLFLEMAKTGMELRAPLVQSDTPQDFSLGFNVTDFTMSDIIWALFDPEGQLPRDPATIALDLSGVAKLLFDPFASDAAQELTNSEDAPAEINALRIERLVVDAIGAKIEAQGDLAFDNSDTTTLPGFPKPVGDIDINIAGANGLMDKLVAIGLLPADQIIGARLMLGLFSVPGAEPDTLTSKIEFNDAGEIIANGQRIR
ncbi:MAG: DUF2125 domain-containing protein [Sulfitobacter sp.]